MDQLYADILSLAENAARKAGIFIREARKTGLHVDAKSRIDFVSDKDLMSENMIREMIREKYPDHLFFGEESVYGLSPEEEAARIEAFREEDFVWVVDPIDGTVNYIRDYPQYAISIGVVHHRRIIAGVIYDPFRDELFSALEGKGAFLNGAPIRVSAAKEAGDAIVNTSMPMNNMTTRADMVSRIPPVSESFQSMRIWNCAAISLASVACGRSDADYEAGIHLWDMAAGIVLVREAGGEVTQMNGLPCALTQTNVLATNGSIHAAAVSALNTK
ncbi:MAG: inositol monophosphatase [Clostridia bacterium]|nr:inositol monophosphatase [Clostridia bacterium]